jgi:hypothetical protein
MKSLVKFSIFAIALGFFASCAETSQEASTEPAATEVTTPEVAPVTEATAPTTTDSNATAPATETTAPATTDSNATAPAAH